MIIATWAGKEHVELGSEVVAIASTLIAHVIMHRSLLRLTFIIFNTLHQCKNG